MGDLSKNFNAAEFFNRHNPAVICNRIKEKLVKPVLQPLRDSIGIPIYITSGYRCIEKNRAVGGKPNSHHLFEADRSACDITCPKMDAVWNWLTENCQIFCYAYWDRKRNFIHISGLTKTDRRTGKMWVLEDKENIPERRNDD